MTNDLKARVSSFISQFATQLEKTPILWVGIVESEHPSFEVWKHYDPPYVVLNFGDERYQDWYIPKRILEEKEAWPFDDLSILDEIGPCDLENSKVFVHSVNPQVLDAFPDSWNGWEFSKFFQGEMEELKRLNFSKDING
ncbi:MAG: hypothetical protein LPK79_14560 [Bacteroidota bacterium]|nr:hypothetical protein [Bacteroidota bacterium]